MSEKYERKVERKYCFFIKDYVEVTSVKRLWLLPDYTWAQEEMGIECPRIKKCRRAEHNCFCIHPESGTDPFIPFTNLLRDLW